MRITCKNCGGDHPVWDCKRPATKSVSEAPEGHVEPVGLASPANALDAGTANTKDAPKFDKKAWQREYMRPYMQKRRAKEREAK